MAILSNAGNTYSSGDPVTATNLNAQITGATFEAGDGAAADGTTLQVHPTLGYLKIKDGGVDSTQLATGAVTGGDIGANEITSTNISSTDGQFLVDGASTQKTVVINDAGEDVDFRVEGDADTNLIVTDGASDVVGIGGTEAGWKLTVDGSTANDTIYAKGNQDAAYVDLKVENEHATGLGCRTNLVQGANSASFQYQESGERATVNVSDGSLSANCGITMACDTAAQGHVRPTGSMLVGTNSNVDLGRSANTWDNVYAANGTIITSDENLKQDIEEITETEKAVAVKAKGLLRKFRMKDAVAQKGEGARTHFGIIAQDLKAAFESEGLDPFKYGILGEDTWWQAEIDGEQEYKKEETEGYAKHTKMSVRYDELLAFIISAL
jgi:hypothetical protein